MDNSEVALIEERKTLNGQQLKAASILALFGFRKDAKNVYGAVAKTAMECQVTPRTVHYWLLIPEFIEAIEAHKVSFLGAGVMGLMKGAADGNATASIRLVEAGDPETWDIELRRQRILKRLEMEFRKELELKFADSKPDLPTPIYHDSSNLPDPDQGARPNGYDDYRKID